MAAPTRVSRSRSLAARRPSRCGASGARLERERDVLGDGQMRKQRRLLIDGGDAKRARRPGSSWPRPAGHRQGARVGRNGAGHDFDQRRLPRAVLADERVNLAGVEIERHPASARTPAYDLVIAFAAREAAYGLTDERLPGAAGKWAAVGLRRASARACSATTGGTRRSRQSPPTAPRFRSPHTRTGRLSPVEKDRVARDAMRDKRIGEVLPDRIVPALVFLFLPLVDRHAEGFRIIRQFPRWNATPPDAPPPPGGVNHWTGTPRSDRPRRPRAPSRRKNRCHISRECLLQGL